MDRKQRWNLKEAKKEEKNGNLYMAACYYRDAGMYEYAGDLLRHETDAQKLHYAVEYYLKGRCFEKALNTWIRLISADSGWSKDDFDELKDHFGLMKIINRAKNSNPFELAFFLEQRGFIDEAFNICLEYREEDVKCAGRIWALSQAKSKIYDSNGDFLKAAEMFEFIGYTDDALSHYRKGKKWDKVEELVTKKYQDRSSDDIDRKDSEIIEIYLEEKQWEIAEEYVLKSEGEKKRENNCVTIIEYYTDKKSFDRLRNWFDKACASIDKKYDCIYPSRGLIKGFNYFRMDSKLRENKKIDDIIYYAKILKNPYWVRDIDKSLEELEIWLDLAGEIEQVSDAYQHINEKEERKKAINLVIKVNRLKELYEFYKNIEEEFEAEKIKRIIEGLDNTENVQQMKFWCPNPECNREIQEGWNRCPYCETKLKLSCGKCGYKIEPGWKRCPICEEKLKIYCT